MLALLLLSLVRANWDEAPPDRATADLTPQIASSPGAGPDGPPAASAQAPADAPTNRPNGSVEQAGRPEGALAPAASRAKAEPEPPEQTAALLLARARVLDALLAKSPNPARALASTVPSQSPGGGMPSRAQIPGAEPRTAFRSSPEPAPGPATLGSRATPQVAGEASPSEDRPVLAPGEVRVFIHHVMDRDEDAALAQRLADHLRSRGFTVADIRPVDLGIAKPSVRYFFEHDHGGSERVVEALGDFFKQAPSRAPDHASDFTHFEPKPRPGNVEVWLPAS